MHGLKSFLISNGLQTDLIRFEFLHETIQSKQNHKFNSVDRITLAKTYQNKESL